MNGEGEIYNHIRLGGAGFYVQLKGLIAVSGKEAVPFLDGLVTNDVKSLADGEQMLAAFPNAQGRLLAIVRILRQGERYLIETDLTHHGQVFKNLFRFTFAGDFFVEDIPNHFCNTSFFGNVEFDFATYSKPEKRISGTISYKEIDWVVLDGFNGNSIDMLIPATQIHEYFIEDFVTRNDAFPISDELYEILRIESGVPKYGVDMDETTIVPELGIDGLISYNKGCYIGQEIIARIHFRGHVAKRLTGIVSEPPAVAGGLTSGMELTTPDGKNAGKITSVTYSPKLDKTIALAFVRYDYLAAGTELIADETKAVVTDLPFVS